MNMKIVSGATLAAAAIALAINGVSVSPALAKKSGKPVHCAGINSCKGTSALQNGEQRLQGDEFLQGAGMGIRQIGEGLRGQGRVGRRNVIHAARTDFVPRRSRSTRLAAQSFASIAREASRIPIITERRDAFRAPRMSAIPAPRRRRPVFRKGIEARCCLSVGGGQESRSRRPA